MVDSVVNINAIKRKLIDENFARDLLIRIRSEYSDIEDYLMNSNAHWEEYFYDTEIKYNKPESYAYKEDNDRSLDYNFNKIYKPNIGNKINSNLKKYYPLRTFYFDNKNAICNVYSIQLNNITTNNSVRDIFIRNDGLITIDKYGKNLSYKLEYSVKDDYYNLNIKNKKNKDHITLKSSESYIIKKYNNLTYIYDRYTRCKYIELNDFNKDLNLSFKYILDYDENNNLKAIELNIDNYKENGRVDTKYHIEVSDNPSYEITGRNGKKINKNKEFDSLLNFTILMIKDYEKSLKEESINKIYPLKKSIQYEISSFLKGNPLYYEHINNNVINLLEDIDRVFSNVNGEIPLSSLNEKIKEDLGVTKTKINKGKTLVRK